MRSTKAMPVAPCPYSNTRGSEGSVIRTGYQGNRRPCPSEVDTVTVYEAGILDTLGSSRVDRVWPSTCSWLLTTA